MIISDKQKCHPNNLLEICKVPESNFVNLASVIFNILSSLYQRTTGSGFPVAWQRSMATLSGGRVWLLGPKRITGGGRRSFSGIITSLESKCANNRKTAC